MRLLTRRALLMDLLEEERVKKEFVWMVGKWMDECGLEEEIADKI